MGGAAAPSSFVTSLSGYARPRNPSSGLLARDSGSNERTEVPRRAQLGINFGGFRLAGTYHMVMGGDIVVATQAVGAPAPTEVKLSKNFFAFEIGGTFGGGRGP